MKKVIPVLLLISLISALFCGCKNSNKNDKLKIVTTIFPEYDWVSNILGEKKDNAELTLLLDNGVDLHNFQPTAEDILKISSCDIFIYVGGESDKWVDDAIKSASNKNMTVINLMSVLGDSVKEEEIVEGMQSEDEHEDEKEYDEHIWLSLKDTKIFVQKIKDAIIKQDKNNADIYEKNTVAYVKNLDELDKKYTDTLQSATLKTLIFADRFPFRYLTDDYGLDYFAAFTGCSSESEASFGTVKFLAEKINEIKPYAVLTLEKSDGKIAKTVISASKQSETQILPIDSMQSTTKKDAENGVTYLSIMENNLDTIKQALSIKE